MSKEKCLILLTIATKESRHTALRAEKMWKGFLGTLTETILPATTVDIREENGPISTTKI